MADDPGQRPRRKSALAQTDVPAYTLNDCLRVARAIADQLGKHPAPPLHVAAAMGIQPTTGTFRMLAGASTAYGLTEGGAWAEKIELTDLGRRVVAPTVEGDDIAAMREAVLRPRLIREFLTRYDGAKWPRDDIAANVLEAMGAPAEQTGRALATIKDNARDHGFLTTIGDAEYVSLAPREVGSGGNHLRSTLVGDVAPLAASESHAPPPAAPELVAERDIVPVSGIDGPVRASDPDTSRRVFISYGSDASLVEQLKTLLAFGGFEAVVAAEADERHESDVPIPFDGMRGCSAAVVQIKGGRRLLDPVGGEVVLLDDRALVEIGAAMALYGTRVVLLVEAGVSLPSAVRSAHEVRYEGGQLDQSATMGLLRAFASFKHPETV